MFSLFKRSPIAGDGFRVVTAFYRLMKSAAEQCGSELVLIDVGPNIGAMNRAALVAADFVVIPLGADLFSLQAFQKPDAHGPGCPETDVPFDRRRWCHRRTRGRGTGLWRPV